MITNIFRLALILAFFTFPITAQSAEKLRLLGVCYILNTDGTASAKADDKNIERLNIPEFVTKDGKQYKVTSIQDYGFQGCEKLRLAMLPNTISVIGGNAFKNCKNLIDIVMPDKAEVIIPPVNFGVGGNGIFPGCIKLATIKGNNIELPYYVVTDALRGCDEVPFLKQNREAIQKVAFSGNGEGNPLEMPPFSAYSESRVRQPMEQWEKRKPYESADDYKSRVTNSSRLAKLNELMGEARESYLKLYSPAHVDGVLDYYDKDYNVYTVKTKQFGDIYVRVPAEDARNFEYQWNNVEIKPRFGILGDKLAILSCDFRLGGKTYNSESVYDDDSQTATDSMLRPLDELIAENTAPTDSRSASSSKVPMCQTVIDPVDIEVPATGIEDKYTFALIIGNEHYQGNIKGVPYAANDAEIFAKYCRRTLGLPANNVRLLTDATLGQMANAIEEIKNKSLARPGETRIIFYYSGHGKPDDNDKQAYMVPVDASPYSNRTNYSLSELYKELGNSNARLVTIFLDACFSGATRTDDMLVAARAMRQSPRQDTPAGNVVVFSAASDTETAHPLESKSHGVFTYCLLEKLRATSGDVTLGELAESISRNVTEFSLEANRPQTPKVLVSPTLPDWRNLGMRQGNKASSKKAKKNRR